MSFKIHIALASALLASSPTFAAPAAEALEVVFVVRHAQKALDEQWKKYPDLRPLSEKGAACAVRRAESLGGEAIAAVYATERTRTISTGMALSKELPIVRVVGDDTVTAEWLRHEHEKDTAILLVGHSNTVQELVLAFRPDAKSCLEKLKLTKAGIPETQYGDMWRLELDPGHTDCHGIEHSSLGRVGGFDCTSP